MCVSRRRRGPDLALNHSQLDRLQQGESMLDRLMRTMVVVVTLTGAATTRAAQVSHLAPCPPDATRETATLESFLTVHVVCSDVLLEIPVAMLGKSMLLYTEFSALSTGGAEYAPGT